jgi:hypothetical protein
MEAIHRVARHAVRRTTLGVFVLWLGRALLGASVLALAAALAERALGPWWDWWWPPAIAAALALTGAAAWALARRPSPIEATARVDHALGLKDRLGSALALWERRDDDPFVAIAARDAAGLAPKVRVRQAIPLRWGGAWWWWPPAAGAAVGVAIFVPPLGLLGPDPDAAQGPTVLEVQAAEQELERTQDRLAQSLDAALDPDIADLAPEESLEKIRDNVVSGQLDPDEGRAEAASVLDEIAEQLDRSAEQAAREQDALREAFSGMDTDGDASSGALDELAAAMRELDAQAATEALDNLERQLQELPEAEREQLAAELERMAADLERAAQQAEQRAREQRERAERELAERGLEDQADQLTSQTDPDQLEQQLEETGANEQTARDLAERLAQQNAERQAQENAAEQARDTSDALRESAEQAQPQEPQPDPPQEQPQEQNQNQDQDRNQDQNQNENQAQEQSQSRPGEQQQQDSQQQQGQQQQQQDGTQGQQGQPQQQQQGQPQQGEPQPGQPSQPDQQQQQQQQPGQSQPQEQPQQQDGPQGQQDQQGQQPQQQQQQQPGEPSGSQGEAQTPTDGANPQPGQQQPQQPGQNQGPGQGQQPGSEQPRQEGSSGPGSSPDAPGPDAPRDRQGFERLREALQQMDESGQRAEQAARRADELREESDALLENLGGQAAGANDAWRRHTLAQQPDPSDEDVMDLRTPSDDGRVVGRINDPNATPQRDPTTISNREVRQELEQALEGVERAIEERTTPARYRNVERYFRRLIERVEAEEAQPAGTPPETKDPA